MQVRYLYISLLALNQQDVCAGGLGCTITNPQNFTGELVVSLK